MDNFFQTPNSIDSKFLSLRTLENSNIKNIWMSQRPAFGKLEEIQTKKCLLRSNNNVLPPTILELQSNNSGCQKYQTLYRINSINKRNDNNSFVTAPLSLFLEVGANNDKKSTVASSSLKVSKANWLKSIFDIIFRTTGCEYASNQAYQYCLQNARDERARNCCVGKYQAASAACKTSAGFWSPGLTDFDALCNRGPGEGPGGNDDGGSDCEDGETTYLTDVDVDIEISPGNTVSCNCNGFFETFNWDGECVYYGFWFL